MKKNHIEARFPWTDQLMVAAQAFKASTERGIGPGRQSCPLPWSKLTALDLDGHFTDPKYPLRLNVCVVIFVFFFMRELECATA